MISFGKEIDSVSCEHLLPGSERSLPKNIFQSQGGKGEKITPTSECNFWSKNYEILVRKILLDQSLTILWILLCISNGMQNSRGRGGADVEIAQNFTTRYMNCPLDKCT